jgi:DNA-binding transcriptional LysR family regulator
MDINLARTFLAVAQTRSFINAAEKLSVTQSTVSLRIKTLEGLLGKPLFERSKAGATLTPGGAQFERHALALVRVWQQAQLEVGLSGQHRDHLAVGAETTLWEGFLLRWIGSLRSSMPDIAVSATTGVSSAMAERLIEGTLDLAVTYRPVPRPGIVIEHLFDEELVLVTSGEPKGRTPGADYVFVSWGAEFEAEHEAAYPRLDYTGLNLELGSLGISYLLDNTASGYFPLRIARPLIRRRRLKPVKGARRFVHPVCALYPEERDVDAYAPILAGLREAGEKV